LVQFITIERIKLFRVTRLADYGIVILTYLAAHAESTCTARDIATVVHLPQPVVSKVLKALCREEIIASQRGVKGGYMLARSPRQITVAEIIRALEGPIAVTECTNSLKDCSLKQGCPVRTNWHRINEAIQSSLERISLAEMAQPLANSLVVIDLHRTPEKQQLEKI
jgi:FeS assembly SUF system regulator